MPTEIGFPDLATGPDRQTRIIGGTGGDTLAFTLAPGLFQYVESVRAVIDNTAGGEARPEIEIATADGAVIANKRQGETIPAGGTGSATWALRLDDERPAAATVMPTFGALVDLNVAQSVSPGAVAVITFDQVEFDTAGMTSGATNSKLTITEDGLYDVRGAMSVASASTDNFQAFFLIRQVGVATVEFPFTGFRVVGSSVAVMVTMFPAVMPMMLQAGEELEMQVRHQAVAARFVSANMSAIRIGTYVP